MYWLSPESLAFGHTRWASRVNILNILEASGDTIFYCSDVWQLLAVAFSEVFPLEVRRQQRNAPSSRSSRFISVSRTATFSSPNMSRVKKKGLKTLVEILANPTKRHLSSEMPNAGKLNKKIQTVQPTSLVEICNFLWSVNIYIYPLKWNTDSLFQIISYYDTLSRKWQKKLDLSPWRVFTWIPLPGSAALNSLDSDHMDAWEKHPTTLFSCGDNNGGTGRLRNCKGKENSRPK